MVGFHLSGRWVGTEGGVGRFLVTTGVAEIFLVGVDGTDGWAGGSSIWAYGTEVTFTVEGDESFHGGGIAADGDSFGESFHGGGIAADGDSFGDGSGGSIVGWLLMTGAEMASIGWLLMTGAEMASIVGVGGRRFDLSWRRHILQAYWIANVVKEGQYWSLGAEWASLGDATNWSLGAEWASLGDATHWVSLGLGDSIGTNGDGIDTNTNWISLGDDTWILLGGTNWIVLGDDTWISLGDDTWISLGGGNGTGTEISLGDDTWINTWISLGDGTNWISLGDGAFGNLEFRGGTNWISIGDGVLGNLELASKRDCHCNCPNLSDRSFKFGSVGWLFGIISLAGKVASVAWVATVVPW
jgi:hypothetical protein